MSLKNLCVMHGGSSHMDECTKCVANTKFCEVHMQHLPCEMCTPTKCLTHKQPLPCKTCLGQDIEVNQVAKDATIEQRLENLEKAIVTLASLIQGKADQSQVSSMQTQVASLSSEVAVLRSL